MRVLIAICLVFTSNAMSRGEIVISEVNSNGVGGDFFEVFNTGNTAVDFGGWRWVDNASAGNGGASFNGARAYAFDSFLLAPGATALVLTDASGNTAGNDAFATSWGLSGASFLTFTVPTGTGNGLGQNDLVALFDSSGVFVTGLNYGTVAVDIVQGDLSTVSLSPFTNSAGGHAGIAGGGAAQVSLVWDPASGASNPLYVAATVGFDGAFAHPTSTVTIGSPGIAAVPEPASPLILGLAGLGLLRRRRAV